MEKGYFYFISDAYYEKFSDENIMTNKEIISGEVHNRPCYYAFQDDEEKQIFWFVPVSSQIDKYKDEYDKSMERYNLCDTILKESIRFRAATKRTAYTKDKLL